MTSNINLSCFTFYLIALSMHNFPRIWLIQFFYDMIKWRSQYENKLGWTWLHENHIKFYALEYNRPASKSSGHMYLSSYKCMTEMPCENCTLNNLYD